MDGEKLKQHSAITIIDLRDFSCAGDDWHRSDASRRRTIEFGEIKAARRRGWHVPRAEHV